MGIGYYFQAFVLFWLFITVIALPLWLMVDVPIARWFNLAVLPVTLASLHVGWRWLHGRTPFDLDYSRRPSLAELHERSALEEDDEDEVPEEAEAFISQMEAFASLDWFPWNHAPARLMYRQRHYWN